MHPWKELLKQWNEDAFESPEMIQDLPGEVAATRWLGNSGCSDRQLDALERRLGARLPNSYKEFLNVTNGWWLATGSVYRLWPTDKVEWLRERHQKDWIEPWSTDQEPVDDDDYFVYGEAQDTVNIRPEYLSTALEISEFSDGVIVLLNPKVLTPEGEWEAWFMGSWLPGARRFRSFWDLMKAEYEMFIKLRNM
jgi:hypothetical protein